MYGSVSVQIPVDLKGSFLFPPPFCTGRMMRMRTLRTTMLKSRHSDTVYDTEAEDRAQPLEDPRCIFEDPWEPASARVDLRQLLFLPILIGRPRPKGGREQGASSEAIYHAPPSNRRPRARRFTKWRGSFALSAVSAPIHYCAY